MEIVLGLSIPVYRLWFVFLCRGFGILHIIYGVLMWWKYERPPVPLKVT
jgi:hypothetical protein